MGAQKEDRLLSSGLRNLPCPHQVGLALHIMVPGMRGGRSPWAFMHSVAPFPMTAIHGTSVPLCVQAMRAAILLWGLML